MTATTDPTPTEGPRQSGWRLAARDQPGDYYREVEVVTKRTHFTESIGVVLNADGTLLDAIPAKAADRAGLGSGMKLVAVNSRRWSPAVLRTALAGTRTADGPLELLLENDELFRTYRLDYHGGDVYPDLERDPSQPVDLFTDIFQARASPSGPGKPRQPK